MRGRYTALSRLLSRCYNKTRAYVWAGYTVKAFSTVIDAKWKVDLVLYALVYVPKQEIMNLR